MGEGLVVDGVSVRLGRRNVVKAVSFEVPSGSSCAVMGPNGSGKTTLLRAISGALPYEGRAVFDREDMLPWTARRRAQTVAVLRQAEPVQFEFRVEEVVRMGRSPYKSLLAWDDELDDEIVRRALEAADLLEFRDRMFHRLSGGEQQRVMLARAFAQEPKLLLLDEPTSHLDLGHQLDVLRRVLERRLTVVAAIHDLNLVARFFDRAVVLLEGEVVAAGPVSEVLTEALIQTVFGVAVRAVEPEGFIFA